MTSSVVTTNRWPFHSHGLGRSLVLAAVLLMHGQRSEAACNLIPQTTKTFEGVLGTANRPFAAPGEPVDLGRRPCDPGGAGFTAAATNYVVTVAFTPPSGTRNVVVLATSCAGIGSCAGAASTTCIPMSVGAGFGVVTSGSDTFLRFTFPDTDTLLLSPGHCTGGSNPGDLCSSDATCMGGLCGTDDDRTFTGPATIAVKDQTVAPVGQAAACELVTQGCTTAAGTTGLVACIDDLFANDGACGRGTPEGTFNHFTALPPPNNFQTACFDQIPPCMPGTDPELRATTDKDGNVLLPMDWRGILVQQNQVPVPRLLRATLAPPVSVAVPGKSFVASYTPEGGLLPPIFEPEFDASAPSGDVTLFGSADAPYTILRIARRSAAFERCMGGLNDGLPCNGTADCPGTCSNSSKRCAVDADCPGGTCASAGTCGPASCVGGANNTHVCNSDNNCPGGECGQELFDVRPFGVGGVGPVVLPRFGAGVCQVNTDLACMMDGQCSSGHCVEYALAAEPPVPLEGLVQTPNVFAFASNEGIDSNDLNGDTDHIDTVVTLRDRDTGVTQPIGDTCPSPGCPLGRAVARTQQPPFSFPALAVEGNVVAFLEPELAQGDIDANGNGQAFESLLRVYRLDATGPVHLTSSLNQAVDAALVVNGRSLAVSNNKVFFRTPEASGAMQATTRATIADDEAEANAAGAGQNQGIQFSADGRFVVFTSDATNLVGATDTNGFTDVFLRDRELNTTELVSLADNGSQGNANSSGGASISADGRYVAFGSNAYNLVTPDANGSLFDVYVRDRCKSNGMQVGGCTASTVRVSVKSDGTQSATGTSHTPMISADGRFVAFMSDVADLVANDTNNAFDIFLHDRDADGNGIFDEDPILHPGSISTIRVSVDSNDSQSPQGVRTDSRPAMSADGRVVVFASQSFLVPGNTSPGIFVHDHTTGITDIVNIATDGTFDNLGWGIGNGEIAVSTDGRYVAFQSNGVTLVPGLSGTYQRIFVRDRVARTTELISRGYDGTDGDLPSSHAAISADGRYVSFISDATNLVPNDTNGLSDVFLRDRVTGITTRTNIPLATPQADGNSGLVSVSADGRFTGFESDATNLLGAGTGSDMNAARDGFVRGPATGGTDLTGDGQLDDTVLQVIDASTGQSASITTLCPAGPVAVSGDNAAFLRPETAGPATGCPAGSVVSGGISLNGDGDASDDVVHLWRGSGNVENLQCAATDISLSDTLLSALVSEADQNNGPLNGDGDTTDTVLEVYKLSDTPPSTCAGWRNVGQAADVAQAAGAQVIFITPESAQNARLNADGDQSDRVLQVYDSSSGQVTNTKQPAEEFVVGTDTVSCGSSPLVAFRTHEADLCGVPVGAANCAGNSLPNGCALTACDLNGDGDCCDDVLQLYAKGLGVLNTSQAVTPCRLEACDPRLPYRVFGDKVKFLTFEPDQGAQDLNHNGSTTDLILQVYDVCPRTVTPVGVVDTASGSAVDPLAQPETQGQVFVTPSGRCVSGSTILLVPASCATTTDCPAGATCESNPVVAAPAAVSAHDSVVLPRAAMTITIPTNTTAVAKKLKVKVRNGDLLEKAGHVIRLSAADGTCPAGTVVGLPDFNSKTAGDQDSLLVAGGKTKTATVLLNIDRTQMGFATISNHLAPRRCTLTVTVDTLTPNNVDPNPRNNSLPVELNVFDKNDPELMMAHESVIKSISPVTLKIGDSSALMAATKTVSAKLVNADLGTISSDTIALTAMDGDCPSGTVTINPPVAPTVASGTTKAGKVTLHVTSAGFTARNAKSPGRCTAILTATGPMSDPDPTNNTTHLVIDVNDQTDY